jgi:hypothetical protein
MIERRIGTVALARAAFRRLAGPADFCCYAPEAVLRLRGSFDEGCSPSMQNGLSVLRLVLYGGAPAEMMLGRCGANCL